MYSYYYRKNEEKPAISISDMFLKAIKETYSVKMFRQEENSMVMEVGFSADKKFILGISDLKRLNFLLLTYISSVNYYYLKVLGKQMDISLDDVFRTLFVRLTQKDAFDFNSYLEETVKKTSEYINKTENGAKERTV